MRDLQGAATAGPWNLKQLRDLVATRGDADRAKRCWSSLQSIDDRQKFAGYHYREFVRLMKARFPSGRTHVEELTTMLTMGDQAWTNLVTEHEASAHVVACMQNMHAVNDTLAQVIYQTAADRLWALLSFDRPNSTGRIQSVEPNFDSTKVAVQQGRS